MNFNEWRGTRKLSLFLISPCKRFIILGSPWVPRTDDPLDHLKFLCEPGYSALVSEDDGLCVTLQFVS